MIRLRPFPILAGLLIFIVLVVSALTQSEPDSLPAAVENPDTETRYERTRTDASLNLHRWGAVTLFHGLPSERVNAITEDLNGALWFGTDNGLVRYDGRSTQAIGGLGDKKGILPSQRIRTLFRDSAGGLWIGTDQGAARWVNEKLQFLESTRGHPVTGFAESNNHEISLATEDGLILRLQNANSDIKRDGEKFAADLTAKIIDGEAQNLLRMGKDPVPLKAIAFNRETSEMWLGSHRRGVMIYENDRLREAAPPPIRPYFVNAIFTEGKNVWFGAQTSANESGLWLHSPEMTLGRVALVTGTINAIHGDVSNNQSNETPDLWIGTDGQGAVLLRNSNIVERVTFENTQGGLRSDRILSVFRDHQGIVWFGTDRGVCRYDRDSFRSTTISNDAQSNFIRALLKTKDGSIYAGTNHGLFHLNAGKDLGGWEPNPEIDKLIVYSLLESSDGKIYAGTSQGLFVAAPGTQFFRFLPSPENARIRSLTEFAGTIYAIAFVEEDPQFLGKGIARLEGEKLQLLLTNETALKATSLSASKDFLRVGTSDGRSFRIEQNTLRAEPGVATGFVSAMLEHDKKIWVGGESGLAVVEKNSQRMVLPNVAIRALSLATEGEDQHQVLYCSTKKAGLYKIRLDGETIAHFDTEQGLPSQQVFATIQGPGGEIWIGTNSGIVRHQPNFRRPKLEPLRMVADNIYTRDYLTGEMRFPSYQTNFSFEFTGLGSKTFPSQFQYEYTCIEEKRGPIGERIITSDSQYLLEKLKPGSYTVKARAISRDLIYSDPFEFKLWITPEAVSWTTIFLTTLLIVAIAAGGYAFYQQRRTFKANQKLESTNAELRDTRIRLAHITEAERSRIARDLHDQTLADLRQLLVMTDQLDQKSFDSPAATPAFMRRKIEEVSNEIRHICEDLSPSVLENIGFIPALEWALTDAVTHLPAKDKFIYEFACEPELEERLRLSPTEQIQLYRIVQEAINNVCRHARASKVILKVSMNGDDEILIEVIDDGIGIQASPENPTGHGMANIRSRANLIGAEASWLTVPNGSHFCVRKANGNENHYRDPAGA